MVGEGGVLIYKASQEVCWALDRGLESGSAMGVRLRGYVTDPEKRNELITKLETHVLEET